MHSHFVMDIMITVSLYTAAAAISTPTANFSHLLVLFAQVLEASGIFRKYKPTVLCLSEQNILIVLSEFWTCPYWTSTFPKLDLYLSLGKNKSWEAPTQLGPLERVNLSLHLVHFLKWCLLFRILDDRQKSRNSIILSVIYYCHNPLELKHTDLWNSNWTD